MRSPGRQFLATNFLFGFESFGGFKDTHSVPRGTEEMAKTREKVKVNVESDRN
jgi:hypothetical protein